MAKWIKFELTDQSAFRKTRCWAVLTKDGDDLLGGVRWYSPWRKYTFTPGGSFVFEENCLRDIATFCERATTARKKARAKS